MNRRDFILGLACTTALPISGFDSAASTRTQPLDYKAWSETPGPDAGVHFQFGTPYLVVSLKTGDSGMYAPHAFRASNGAIYLGYYPWPDEYESDPYPAALLRSLDNGITWHSLAERPNFGYFFGETGDGTVWAVDCWNRHPSNQEFVYEAQRFVTNRHVAPEVVKVKLSGFRPGQEPFWHLNRFVRA